MEDRGAAAPTTLVRARRLAPAELRLIDFRRGDGRSGNGMSALVATLSAGGIAAASPFPWLAVLAPVVGGGTWYALELVHRRDPDRHPLLRPCSLTLTPWGAIAGGPIPWPDITSFIHVLVRRDRKSEPDVYASSVIYLDSDGERLQAQRDHDPFLEHVSELLPGLAFDAALPVALDLEEEGRSAPATTGVFGELLAAARHLIADGRASGLVSASPGGYRTSETNVPPETVARLRRELLEAPSIADRAPLAALLAGELGLTSLDQDLCALVMSPHPLVAASCKAAALRLGVSAVRAGAIQEVSPFVAAEDLAAMEVWAHRRA